MKAGKFNSWVDMFVSKLSLLANPEVPVLNAWVNVDKMSGALMRFERNPYYWKVDTAGNQLPYIDKQEMYLFADAAACVLKALAGEIDFQYREISGAANYAALMKNADKGGYYIVPTETLNSNQCTVFMNRTTTDPIHNKLFNDLRFRQALSYAIDRNEINTLTRNGMVDATQVAPPKSAASWEKATAKMYTKFDIAAANKLLDAVGLKWDARHEWRLGPDGKALSFTKIFYNDPDGNGAHQEDLEAGRHQREQQGHRPYPVGGNHVRQ